MTKSVVLLLGAIAVIAAAPRPARAGGEIDLGFSLPIGVTGPATNHLDRLHTAPRLPVTAGDTAAAPVASERPPLQALKPESVITVSQ